MISKLWKSENKGFRAQDIQVLAPMYRGPAGIDALNKMMQEIFNPGKPGKGSTLERHRLSDRRQSPPISQYSRIECIQWRYGRNHGYHLGKDSEDKVDELVIQFDANEVTYKETNGIKSLFLIVAQSINQGSEFKMVILPMVHQYQRMLQRNLLYTAVIAVRNC